MAAEPTSPAQPPQLPTAGSLAGILDVLETDDDFRALIAGEIEEPESDIDPSITVGVPDGLRPALAAGAAGKQPVVLVVASSREAEEAVESIRSWYDGDPNDVAQLEAWETLPHERLSPRADTVASRMAVFRRLKHPEEGSTLFGPIRILVMPVRSLIQPVVAGLGDVEPLVFSQGEELPLDEASRKLVENAYTRVDLVMDRGEFAVRGGIIDVFPPTLPHPVRIEFFGDEIDRITEFNPLTGTKQNVVKHVAIFPASHYIVSAEKKAAALEKIRAECDAQVKQFTAEGKLIEAQRIAQRTNYDIEMLNEVGMCKVSACIPKGCDLLGKSRSDVRYRRTTISFLCF